MPAPLLKSFGMPFALELSLRSQAHSASNRFALKIESKTHATTAKRVKDAKKPKFKSRQHNRCQLCGRPSRVPSQVRRMPSLLPFARPQWEKFRAL